MVNPASSLVKSICALSNGDATPLLYSFTPVAGIAVEGPAGYHYASLPSFVLDAGCTIRVYDSAAIQPAADDMVVTVTGAAYH